MPHISDALNNNLLTDCKACEVACIRNSDSNHTALIEEIEACLVYKRRTNDTANPNLCSDLLSNSLGDCDCCKLLVRSNGYGDCFAICVSAVRSGDSYVRLTGFTASKKVVINRNNACVVGCVSKCYTLEAEKLGGNCGGKLNVGVALVHIKELSLAVVLNCVLRRVCNVELVALVNNCYGEKSPSAACGRAFCIKNCEIYCADLAVELVKPLEVATVALSVCVSTGLAVDIEEVVVNEA